MLRKLLVIGVLGISSLIPSAASAITVDQVVALAKSGVTDTVILALIDRDRTVFAIEPEQIVSLQRDGLSEQVILAMLKSGRDEGEQAARADSANNAAWIASTLSTEPESISVGHGPDRPNTPHIDGFYSGPPVPAFGPAYWRRPHTAVRPSATARRRSGRDPRPNLVRSATRRSALRAPRVRRRLSRSVPP